MTYSESAALRALKNIKDPLSDGDIISAGRLSDLTFKDGVLQAILQIDPDHASAYQEVQSRVETTLKAIDGVSTARVILSAHKAAPNIKTRSSSGRAVRPHQARRPEGYQGDAHVKTIIAVSSAKGGVGKSTIAVNLSVALARSGHKVGLLDADIHGPSLPLLMGLSGQRAGTHKREGRMLITPLEAHGIKAMSIGFLTKDDGPIVWRGPMVQGAISRMLWDVDWGELDYLIIDMPPGTGDPQLGLAQDIKPKGAIIVSTPQDLALIDAKKGVQMFEKVHIPILGLVENMSVFICPTCESAHSIFGQGGGQQEAKQMDLPFLGAAPLMIDIRQSGDQGTPIAATDHEAASIFSDMATRLLKQMA